jgi:hypothetical protein
MAPGSIAVLACTTNSFYRAPNTVPDGAETACQELRYDLCKNKKFDFKTKLL